MYPTPVSSVWSRDRPSVAVKLRLFYKISNFELAGNEKWRRRYPTPAAEDTVRLLSGKFSVECWRVVKKRPRIRPRCRVSIRRKSIGYRQTHFVSDPLRTGGSSSSHFNTIGADIELSEMVPTVATLDVDLFYFFLNLNLNSTALPLFLKFKIQFLGLECVLNSF